MAILCIIIFLPDVDTLSFKVPLFCGGAFDKLNASKLLSNVLSYVSSFFTATWLQPWPRLSVLKALCYEYDS